MVGEKRYPNIETVRHAVTAKPWLAFGALIRNEAPYLLEWVEFHLPVGFDIFYVWDDGSTDASLSVIQQYIDSGVVRRLDMGGVKYQHHIYTRMVRQADHDGVEWLMLTDVDVFVFPERATSLRDILTSFDSSVGAIGLSLFQFDHNGRMQQDAGPVIERFVHRRKIDDPFNGAMTRTFSLLRTKNVITWGFTALSSYAKAHTSLTCSEALCHSGRTPKGRTYLASTR